MHHYFDIGIEPPLEPPEVGGPICDNCGEEIRGTAYRDRMHNVLCRACLLALHEI